MLIDQRGAARRALGVHLEAPGTETDRDDSSPCNQRKSAAAPARAAARGLLRPRQHRSLELRPRRSARQGAQSAPELGVEVSVRNRQVHEMTPFQ